MDATAARHAVMSAAAALEDVRRDAELHGDDRRRLEDRGLRRLYDAVIGWAHTADAVRVIESIEEEVTATGDG